MNTYVIRVLFADDHEIFRWGMNTLFKTFPNIELVGEAKNGKELIELAEKLQPDVIVTDIVMPLINGIEATRIITKNSPNINVLALSMLDEEDTIVEFLEAGGKGYLIKNADKEELADAIKTVCQSMPYYCKHTSTVLAKMIARSKFNTFKTETTSNFTEREREVIRMTCEGYSTKEIADRLFLSVRSIEGIRMRILEKMEVKNTAGLVIYAIRHGIYDPDKTPTSPKS